MSLPVHFLPELGRPRVGERLALSGEEAHHAVAVRRLRVGEALVITDGLGGRAVCRVVSAERRALSAVCEAFDVEPEPTPHVTVIQALAKGDRADLAVELATELGAARIVPWAASRSVSVWRGDRAAKGVEKWRATAREAAKQSRRSWFPEVSDLASTAAACGLLAECVAAGGAAFALHEEATEALAAQPVPAYAVVIVGPEGGISTDELARFVEAGATPVLLGPEVLRTSTAGAAALVALQSRTTRWGGSPAR